MCLEFLVPLCFCEFFLVVAQLHEKFSANLIFFSQVSSFDVVSDRPVFENPITTLLPLKC